MFLNWKNYTLALGLAAISPFTFADYPDRAVKIIVPFAAGGFTDSVARIVAQELTKMWGQSVLVNNHLGAGGNIGATLVAKSPADGYTLLLATNTTHGTNPTLYRDIQFDAIKDFTPVVLMATTPNVFVTTPKLPINSMSELIATVKAQPNKFSYGSTGVGSSVHLQAEQFKSVAGLQMTHVPYKGSSQALTDLISGQVQVMFDNFLFQLPQIKANNVKALAITSKRRSPLLPDVPTMAEVGVQGFDYGPWFGIVAPAKTPQFIIAKINSDINTVLQMKDVQDKLQGAEILGGTSLQFAVFMEKDIAKWAKLIRELNLKAD